MPAVLIAALLKIFRTPPRALGRTATGPDEAATHLLVANTSADAGQIQVTATPAGGTPVVQTYPIPGNARLTVDLAWFGFVDQPFSVAIESLASTKFHMPVPRWMKMISSMVGALTFRQSLSE